MRTLGFIFSHCDIFDQKELSVRARKNTVIITIILQQDRDVRQIDFVT
jgi:hypothetical protein